MLVVSWYSVGRSLIIRKLNILKLIREILPRYIDVDKDEAVHDNRDFYIGGKLPYLSLLLQKGQCLNSR